MISLLLAQQVSDSFMPSGQLLAPAGVVRELAGSRPVDLRVSLDGSTLFIKDRDALRIVDASTLQETAKVPSPEGASLWGLDVAPNAKRVLFTSSTNKLHEFRSLANNWSLSRSIELPGPGGKGNSFPCGVVVAKDGKTAYVCLSINNTVGVVDLSLGRLVKEIGVGISPYDIQLSEDGQTAYVSNQGGELPGTKAKTAPSAGTETLVDDRGVGASGTVAVVSLATSSVIESIPVGLQPSQVVVTAKHVIVADANSDTLSWIDRDLNRKVRQMVIKPDLRLPFGSMPNALALAPDGERLLVALAGNNAVGVIDNVDGKPSLTGFLPTGWFPTAVQVHGKDIYVANNKGVGSRTKDPAQKGRSSHQHRGSIQKLQPPSNLQAMTAKVRELAFTTQILRAMERQTGSTAKPLPIPRRLGDPSTIEHVIYVIKENRTYDQMFGDLPRGDNDPSLCTFPEINSPNHHALAQEFVQLDNYYCNGVLSADGHSWATEGNVTPYLQRAFGGFNRSYTFGDDPITYSSSGFIWDHILAAGLSFRNYGEMNYSETLPKKSYKEVLAAYRRGERVKFTNNIGIERLRRYSNLDTPGWNMDIPDVARIEEFLREFRVFEKNGRLPNFTILYLPQDHLGGPVSASAHMADNDLAIGRLVQEVSKSRFWPKTAIFINEDDPQNGFDHVDGHRSICLVVSPYTKRKALVSEFYNQTSVIRTMLHILGVSPMNQRDASSSLMTSCFTERADFSPYTARSANFSLDDSDLKVDNSPSALHWAQIKKTIPIKRTGMKTEKDEDNLNRLIWHEMKGWHTPYPAALAGAHGKGLAKRNLKHSQLAGGL